MATNSPHTNSGPQHDGDVHRLDGPDQESKLSGIRPVGELTTAIYDEWKRNGRHLAEYASEWVGTAFSVFWVVGVVAFMFAPGSPMPGIVPSHAWRLFITGWLLGIVSWIVALTPPGKLSGAHLNPAVSTGFWLLGKMHLRDYFGYIVAQMVGAGAGAYAGVWAFAGLARAVNNASLKPGPQTGVWGGFAGELGATFALTFVVYTFVSYAGLQRFTPAAAALMVGILVGTDGGVSGSGMNPARWFGPALTLDYWHLAWIYIAGPVLGAAAAALVRRYALRGHRKPYTGKRVHDQRYRSIFRDDALPSTPPPQVHARMREP